ncbi:HAAS signaling domain-containing protein [Dactylosporangium sp. CS-033363]|uniref:HAAS signaling domain-containing protein n=1 Tax=Dactylosporangium sp. CS-033363 TaxID=3239935 RepID=UPI003D8E0312
MTTEDLIERYVADVVALLPRRQRHDVAMELRTLLHEEAGDAPDVPEMLRRFGHPAEVAARYGTPVALIDPVDTRRFLTLAAGGTVIIQLGAFLGELIKPVRDFRGAADDAWPLVFGWLGVLFAVFAAMAWWRRRHPARWRPRPLPTDRINRTGRLFAVAFYLLGTVILLDPAAALRLVTGGRAAQAAYDAFAYDPAFLRYRGPVLLALLLSGIALQVVLAWLGRWRAPLQTADLVYSLVLAAGLTWIIATPIFTAGPTDELMREACALTVLGALIDLGLRVRRLSVTHALAASHDGGRGGGEVQG